MTILHGKVLHLWFDNQLATQAIVYASSMMTLLSAWCMAGYVMLHVVNGSVNWDTLLNGDHYFVYGGWSDEGNGLGAAQFYSVAFYWLWSMLLIIVAYSYTN